MNSLPGSSVSQSSHTCHVPELPNGEAEFFISKSRTNLRPPHRAECIQLYWAGWHASQGPEGAG